MEWGGGGMGYLCRSSNPLPSGTERRNVRHDAQHRFLATEHGLRFYIAEPHFQIGCQIFAHQFQHGHVSAAVQLSKYFKQITKIAIAMF